MWCDLLQIFNCCACQSEPDRTVRIMSAGMTHIGLDLLESQRERRSLSSLQWHSSKSCKRKSLLASEKLRFLHSSCQHSSESSWLFSRFTLTWDLHSYFITISQLSAICTVLHQNREICSCVLPYTLDLDGHTYFDLQWGIVKANLNEYTFWKQVWSTYI